MIWGWVEWSKTEEEPCVGNDDINPRTLALASWQPESGVHKVIQSQYAPLKHFWVCPFRLRWQLSVEWHSVPDNCSQILSIDNRIYWAIGQDYGDFLTQISLFAAVWPCCSCSLGLCPLWKCYEMFLINLAATWAGLLDLGFNWCPGRACWSSHQGTLWRCEAWHKDDLPEYDSKYIAVWFRCQKNRETSILNPWMTTSGWHYTIESSTCGYLHLLFCLWQILELNSMNFSIMELHCLHSTNHSLRMVLTCI